MTDTIITKEQLAEIHTSCAQALGIILSLPNQRASLVRDVKKQINYHCAEAHRLNPDKHGEFSV